MHTVSKKPCTLLGCCFYCQNDLTDVSFIQLLGHSINLIYKLALASALLTMVRWRSPHLEKMMVEQDPRDLFRGEEGGQRRASLRGMQVRRELWYPAMASTSGCWYGLTWCISFHFWLIYSPSKGSKFVLHFEAKKKKTNKNFLKAWTKELRM